MAYLLKAQGRVDVNGGWYYTSIAGSASGSRQPLSNARAQLVNIATARSVWAAAGLMALFYIASGFATAVFFKQQHDLHMDTQAECFLQLVGGIFGVVAAVGYGVLYRRLNQPAHAVGWMHDPGDGRQSEIPVLFDRRTDSGDRAAQWLRLHAGGTGRGPRRGHPGRQRRIRLLADGERPEARIVRHRLVWLELLDAYYFSFDSLVIANSVTTAVAVPLVFLSRRIILSRKDAESF